MAERKPSEPKIDNHKPEKDPVTKRAHRATYATDKRKGGYIVRVEGPNASAFLNREVPVTLRNGSEQVEKLTKVLWSGKDEESGQPVTLYNFEAKPRDLESIDF